MVADATTVEILAALNIDLNIATLTDLAEQMECHDYPTAAWIARSGAHALLICQNRITELEQALAGARQRS